MPVEPAGTLKPPTDPPEALAIRGNPAGVPGGGSADWDSAAENPALTGDAAESTGAPDPSSTGCGLAVGAEGSEPIASSRTACNRSSDAPSCALMTRAEIASDSRTPSRARALPSLSASRGCLREPPAPRREALLAGVGASLAHWAGATRTGVRSGATESDEIDGAAGFCESFMIKAAKMGQRREHGSLCRWQEAGKPALPAKANEAWTWRCGPACLVLRRPQGLLPPLQQAAGEREQRPASLTVPRNAGNVRIDGEPIELDHTPV